MKKIVNTSVIIMAAILFLNAFILFMSDFQSTPANSTKSIIQTLQGKPRQVDMKKMKFLIKKNALSNHEAMFWHSVNLKQKHITK